MNTYEVITRHRSSKASYSHLDKLGAEIMATWEGRVRDEVKSASELLRPALRDALPKFLGLLSTALSEKRSRGMIEEGSEMMRLHAGLRARESGFGPSEIIQELQLLREIVTSRLEKEVNLSPQDYETIRQTFDQAIQEALMEFFLVHAQLREQFMATLSHDLRGPIGVGKMGAEIIQEIAEQITDQKTKKEIQDIADRIKTNMTRADRMIQDLLDASVLRIGEKLPVEISHCDLLVIANDVVKEIDATERDRIQVFGHSVSGYWDCEGLRRGLENLVRNAIKYGGVGEPITIRISSALERVRVSVHNWGNPIPEQDQKLIFRTFGRTKSAQASGRQGWGLGLALVRAVTESLGGCVEVESSAQAGTTFTLDLPIDSRQMSS